MKRYAIVRVDINCPKDVCGEEDFCFLSKGKTLEDMCDYCDFLNEKRIIGDTKEQLENKIAQALLKDKIKMWKLWNCTKKEPTKETVESFYKRSLKQAKEIVEFLGVEE